MNALTGTHMLFAKNLFTISIKGGGFTAIWQKNAAYMQYASIFRAPRDSRPTPQCSLQGSRKYQKCRSGFWYALQRDREQVLTSSRTQRKSEALLLAAQRQRSECLLPSFWMVAFGRCDR